ncbi:MAG: DUF4158 domain-containing protein [Stellaceae bacterium]
MPPLAGSVSVCRASPSCRPRLAYRRPAWRPHSRSTRCPASSWWLTEAQIATLFDPATDRRELVRHYTLTEPDIAMIRRCRGDHNRLGYALMLCYLHHPGRPYGPMSGRRWRWSLLSPDRSNVRPEGIADYLASEQNRRRPRCRIAGPASAPSLRETRDS